MADLLPNDCMQYVTNPIERAVVTVESSFNPYAIGVVNGRLERQPRNKQEAVATALNLKRLGFNYSVGCRQVNQANFSKYGLDIESAFDPEKNALAGSAIYGECLQRAVAKFGNGIEATKAATSCYYSGNFKRGQQKEGNQPSYVDKVLANLLPGERNIVAQAIPVIAKGSPVTKAKRPAADKDAAQPNAAQPEGPQTASWDVFKEF
jgi:type IV secretion system protein VirB1